MGSASILPQIPPASYRTLPLEPVSQIQIQIGIQVNILLGPDKAHSSRNCPAKSLNALESAKLLQKLSDGKMRHLNFQ
jgi:hypothetical protein